MGILLLGPERERELRDLAAEAAKEENWFRIGISDFVPGNLPKYTRILETYRLVFTITVLPDGEKLRHMSFSSPGDTYPNPMVTFQVASLLGFTGAPMYKGFIPEPGPDWGIRIDEDEHCIVLTQPIAEGG